MRVASLTSKLTHEHAIADGAKVLRLAVVDARFSRPIPKDDTIFFAPPKGHRRKLKDDAPPGVVSFVDYHWRGDGGIYIDFASTRKDQRGKGYVRLLLDTLLTKHAEAAYFDLGGVQSPTIWKYYEAKAAEGVPIYAHDWDEEEDEEEEIW